MSPYLFIGRFPSQKSQHYRQCLKSWHDHGQRSIIDISNNSTNASNYYLHVLTTNCRKNATRIQQKLYKANTWFSETKNLIFDKLLNCQLCLSIFLCFRENHIRYIQNSRHNSKYPPAYWCSPDENGHNVCLSDIVCNKNTPAMLTVWAI